MIKRIFALLLLAALPCMADATLQQALDSIDEWLTQAAQTGFGGGGGTDFSTANSYTYDDGTTQSVDGLIVRGDLTLPDGSITSNMLANGSITSNMLANGSIGTNHLSQGTIDWIEGEATVDNDLSDVLLGYPRLTLTTNMLSLIGTSAHSGGTPAHAIDGSYATAYSQIIAPQEFKGVMVDLGQPMHGVIVYNVNATAPRAPVVGAGLFGAVASYLDSTTPTYGVGYVSGVDTVGATDFKMYAPLHTDGTTNMLSGMLTFYGRYAGIQFRNVVLDTDSFTVFWRDISIYASTNGISGFGTVVHR